MNNIFGRFPKKRTKLPEKYEKIYQKEYLYNRSSKGFINSIKHKLEAWMHYRVAHIKGENILEIGAGTLNHVKYEKKYKIYDVVEPNQFLYIKSGNRRYINNIYRSAKEIPRDKVYDKIFSIAVFEHLENLPEEINILLKHLKKGGILQAAIPGEGNILWGICWRLTTAVSFYIRYGLNYGLIMKHEHINDYKEITEIIKFFFKNIKIKYFPFKYFCIYLYIEARK